MICMKENAYPLFKVKGIGKLMTLDELGKVAGINNRCIRVVDLKTQKNWLISYKVVLEKFSPSSIIPTPADKVEQNDDMKARIDVIAGAPAITGGM